MRYLLGLDDTDSRFGHCTTHLGYLIACELTRLGCALPAYPRLVRLNPNIPFKTRGNAAVCIEFEASSDRIRDEAFKAAQHLLVAEADVKNGANSALIMAKDGEDGTFFRDLYLRAVNGVVNYRGVIKGVSKMGLRHELLGNGMGIVGAAASLGFSCDLDDHTFELISYREPENCGSRRAVDTESVRDMDARTFPHTFNSLDHESGRVLITPTGPDPVLAGIRGDSPGAVLRAFQMIRTDEEILGHIVYATNQCTDAHLSSKLSMPLKAFSAGWLEGSVLSVRSWQGGHLMVSLRTMDSTVGCMVYEPAGDLKRIARRLKPNDSVRVSGSVRRASSKNPAVVNVEKIDILEVSPGDLSRGARGRIYPGTYLPSPRAQRHLTKQLIRYGREQFGGSPLIDGWLGLPSQASLAAPSFSSASSARLSIRAA